MSGKMSYTERLAAFRDASAPRRRKRKASKAKAPVKAKARASVKAPRRRVRATASVASAAMVLAPRRPSMHVQSLLFSRRSGWTEGKAKAWAKSHGYKHGDVDITDDYIHLRQSPPRGGVTRTITFGKGIKARVQRGTSREGAKETTAMAKRRRSKKTTAPRRRRRAHAAPAAAPRRRRRRHVATPAAAPRRRRRRRHTMAAAPRRRRRRHTRAAAAPRRRRRRARHVAAPRRRRRRHVAAPAAAAPRRRSRRARSYASASTYAPRRRRHGRRAHALSNPLNRGELALAVITGGVGFALADFVDRYLATYDPGAVAAGTATAPTDRFSGGTNGTLANTLNIASPPSIARIGAGIGITAVPALGAYLVKNSMGRAALQGMMLGAGIKLFSTLWNAYVMGNLLKPAASDQSTMQKSLGARLYPAEVVAAQNLAASPPAYTAPTGLNAPPRNGGLPPRQPYPSPQAARGVGDPGPFAVGDDGGGMVPPPGNVPPVCGPGLVADSVTGDCIAPCDDGSTPANGLCPPNNTQPPMPPQPPPGYMPPQPPMPPPGGGGCSSDCGLSAQLPQYLGFFND